MIPSHSQYQPLPGGHGWSPTFLHSLGAQTVGGDFPIDTFPPMVQEAIWAVQQDLQVAMSLVAVLFLSAMFLACQGVYDVCSKIGQIIPCSGYLFLIAGSGSGKTPAEKLIYKLFRRFDELAYQKYLQALADYKTKHRAWEAIDRALQTAISKKVQKGLPTDEEQNAFVEHAKTEPIPPRLLGLLRDNVTPEALTTCWHKHGISQALVSAEAGEVLNGRGFSNLYLFNQVWGGDPIRSDRNTSESFTVAGPRLSMMLCVQPDVFQRFIARRGQAAVENGFLARALIVQIREQPALPCEPLPVNEMALPAFYEKVGALLDRYAESNGEGARECLHFSPEATRCWQNFCTQLKLDTQPGGSLAEYKDYVAKLTNNVVRVAGVFHVFNGDEGPISVATYMQAERLCRWMAAEYLSLFPRTKEVTLFDEDANVLFDWLSSHYPAGGVSLRTISQRGPNSLRVKGRRDAALAYLMQQRRVSVLQDGKTTLVFPLIPTF